MESLQFSALGTAGNIAVFAAATCVVWVAGGRLARYGSIIADRTALGHAFVGTALLGVLASLPEMTLSGVAAAFGNAELAVNALIGGVGVTMAMLAVADVMVKREALSRYVEEPVVLLQGALTVLMLTACVAAIVTGDRLLPGVGIAGSWTTILFVFYLAALWLVREFQRQQEWRPESTPFDADHAEGGAQQSAIAAERRDRKHSLVRILGLTCLAALAVFGAGIVLAGSASALPEQIGWSAGFVALLLGGVSTSLPELSTAMSAARLNRFEMAFMDIFGSNQCSIALLFVADLLYPGGPILNQVGAFSTVALLLGCALTSISLAGLVARPKWRIMRMGVDSAAILATTAIGLVLLYRMA